MSVVLTGVCALDLTLYTAIVPLYIPTARRLGFCLEKSKAVTPELTLNTRSGYSGFLMDQQHAIPGEGKEGVNFTHERRPYLITVIIICYDILEYLMLSLSGTA